MSVKVTEVAAREICSIIEREELDASNIYLRVGVKGGGCSGFSYVLDLTEAIRDTDEIWEFSYEFATGSDDATGTPVGEAQAGGDDAATGVALADGESTKFTLKVNCDPKSYLYLNETEIDFKDEMMAKGFVFNNPNATNVCGCGSSFSA